MSHEMVVGMQVVGLMVLAGGVVWLGGKCLQWVFAPSPDYTYRDQYEIPLIDRSPYVGQRHSWTRDDINTQWQEHPEAPILLERRMLWGIYGAEVTEPITAAPLEPGEMTEPLRSWDRMYQSNGRTVPPTADPPPPDHR